MKGRGDAVMTVRETAERIAQGTLADVAAIEAAILGAIHEEREACAKVARETVTGAGNPADRTGDSIAAAIEARGANT